MTRQEAIKLMEQGLKVTHDYFSEDEWMTIKNGKYVFEDGVKCNPDEFWKYRQDASWDEDWSIYEDQSFT